MIDHISTIQRKGILLVLCSQDKTYAASHPWAPLRLGEDSMLFVGDAVARGTTFSH